MWGLYQKAIKGASQNFSATHNVGAFASTRAQIATHYKLGYALRRKLLMLNRLVHVVLVHCHRADADFCSHYLHRFLEHRCSCALTCQCIVMFRLQTEDPHQICRPSS
jgi:hypothetical protein